MGMFGHVPEMSETPHNGLQNRVPRFNSGRGLQQSNQVLMGAFNRSISGGFSPGIRLGLSGKMRLLV